ncbi:MAG: PIG-L deacetylase family protein [Candidatus Methanofastidiosia archaeon]
MTKKLLAIFAHPDDEISAIGTLANHTERGDEVYLTWMTEGRKATTLKVSEDEKAEIRKRQAKKIGKLIGAKTRFLNFKDAEIFPSREAALKVSELIKEVKPQILITWNKFLSTGAGHPDHRYTSEIVLDALTYARFPEEKSKFSPHRDFVNVYLAPFKPSEFPIQYIDISDREKIIRKLVEIYSGMYGFWDVLEWKLQESARNGRMTGCKLAEAFSVVQKVSCGIKYLD